MEIIIAIAALVPITYLFINRGIVPSERRPSTAARIGGAAVWGLVYAIPFGYLLGLLGLLIAVGIAVYAYLR